MIAVAAMSLNRVIGRDNKIPWHLPEDFKWFKKLTTGHFVLMGRKTFESLGRLLPGRRHIVLTRDPDWRADGAEIAHSVNEALDLARNTPPNSAVSIIGGAEVFALLLPHTTRIEVTEVHADVAGDTFVPPFGPEWREVAREDYAAEGDTPAYSFVSLEHAA